jgi:AbrB family looped-hinge helix DNA binding protein
MYTGLTRRIDNLGRIVIPKEIRKSLNISEGDNLEIGVDGKEITLRKYYPYDSVDNYIYDFACYMRAASKQAEIPPEQVEQLEQAIDDIRTVWCNNFP